MKQTDRKQVKSTQNKINHNKEHTLSKDRSQSRYITPQKDNVDKQNIQKEKRIGISTQPRPNKFQDYPKQLQSTLSDLIARKQKMQVCIDLFNLMHSNNMQLRCTIHNNTLTLYCLTERRVLCVNCIYGVTKHRTHKIIPLKDSIAEIVQDNQILRHIIDSDLKVLEEGIKNSQMNTVIIEKEMKKTLESLENNFHRQIEELKFNYDQKKAKVRQFYEPMIQKAKKLQNGIEQFKFKIWETLSKIGIGKRNESSSHQTQVIRQVLCVNLSELTKFQINHMTQKQLSKLRSKI